MATAFTQATQKDDGKGLDVTFNSATKHFMAMGKQKQRSVESHNYNDNTHEPRYRSQSAKTNLCLQVYGFSI